MNTWMLLGDAQPEDLGFLPDIIQAMDPRPAAEQLNDRYAHGGGYGPFGQDKWTMGPGNVLNFPGDPPFRPLAFTVLPGSDEVVIFYPAALLAICKADKTFTVTRVD